MRPPALGSIGARGYFPCVVNGVTRIFDGTTTGLVRVALAEGAVIGDTMQADYGAGYRQYRLIADASPGRGGVFAELVRNSSSA